MTLEKIHVAPEVRFDHHPDGFGTGTDRPAISWRYVFDGSSAGSGWSQKSYLVEIQRVEASRMGMVAKPLGRTHVVSGSSVMNSWPARPLRSREMMLVRVLGAQSARDFSSDSFLKHGIDLPDAGIVDGGSTWTARFCPSPADLTVPPVTSVASWKPLEVGLLHASDWNAKFITSPDPSPPDNVPHRPMLYRKTFTCDATNARSYARLYISSLGLYEAYINGHRVGDHQMAPGWTSYHHRLQYQTYDVSKLLKSGSNVISVEVAEGWYAGRLLWVAGLRNLYGDKPGFIAQLEVHDYEQGFEQVISDDSWTCHPSPRLSASIYDGEAYDARQLVPGWTTTDLKDHSAWQKTRVLNFDFDKVKLVATDAPPVRITQTVKPINVFKSPSGKTLVDFGQNLVGRVQIQGVQKAKGHSLKIRHAEVLENGELGTRPLRNAKATDEYIFSGDETDAAQWSWTPHFTFHGFRYIELEGWSPDDDVPPSASTLSAHVVGSDMKRTGHFKCSNELVNKLHENVTWSMRGNFLSVPTDCPQRDERLGWTGDIQAFAPTASFLYASAGFLTNWLVDLAIDQTALGSGCVPVVVPDVLQHRLSQNDNPVAVWDDAAILVPWTVHRWTGDVGVLRAQWASMQAHLHKSIRRGPDGLWDESLFQYGDWLDPNAPADQAELARTDGTLVADAYLVHVTDVMARIGRATGDEDAAGQYQAEFERLRAVFAAKYVSERGLVVSDSQTGLALAICFDLLASPAQVEVAGARLTRLVRQAGCRVSTGFAGTPLILHALTRTGQTDLAYEMLLTKECPSWLYPVTMGATTVWERWDSMLPDGRVNPGEMTSFNHYALGSVADWLHTVVGGVRMRESGWGTFVVRPRPGGGLSWAEVGFEGPFGWVSVRWEVKEGVGEKKVFTMKVDVPPNARALVVLPGQQEEEGVWKSCGVCEMVCEL